MAPPCGQNRFLWNKAVIARRLTKAHTSVFVFFKAPSVVPKMQSTKTWKSSIEFKWDEIPIEQRNGIIRSYKIFYWNKKGPVNGKFKIWYSSKVQHTTFLNVFLCLTCNFSLSRDRWPSGKEARSRKPGQWACVWSFYDGQHIWWKPEWVKNLFSSGPLWLVLYHLVNTTEAQHVSVLFSREALWFRIFLCF